MTTLLASLIINAPHKDSKVIPLRETDTSVTVRVVGANGDPELFEDNEYAFQIDAAPQLQGEAMVRVTCLDPDLSWKSSVYVSADAEAVLQLTKA